jgi:hypothetical protein
MSNPINMVKLVEELLKRPRGRACVVLTHDYNGQNTWGAELAKQTGADHIDLLDLFAGDAALAGKISSFSVSELFTFLIGKGNSGVLIVTGLEFIKATWSGQPDATDQFATLLETWGKSPALLFVMQFDPTLAKRMFKRFPDKIFVVNQKDTLALT